LDCDVAIVGGGIVGLATAFQLSRALPTARLVVLEKEQQVAQHQSGHNSGVLHSGIYYKPGSLKAINCRAGKLAMQEFCAEHGIRFEVCGKVIVAVDEAELPALHRIHERGQANGVACRLIDASRLAELEPHAAGVAAIHVPEAGIVDYRQVCVALVELIRKQDQTVLTGAGVRAIERRGSTTIVQASGTDVACRLVVNCAGLQCDRVSALGGLKPAARIIPFRGEYYELVAERRHLCNNLIYPVPDPKFPFLGVHLTRMISGGVECGPNAVLAAGRHAYRKLQINPRDLLSTLAYRGFWRMASRHWRMGCGEMWRSLSKSAFVAALRRLLPELRAEDLRSGGAGIRAQAVGADGQLVDDFLIIENEWMITVNNAPSPAATASLNIGRLVADKIVARLQ